MIRRGFLRFVGFAMFAPLLAGCGGGPEGGNVTLAEAGGTVTFKGSPLADATVTFIPDQGPAAMGITDLSGKFKLSSGTRPGVAVGNCKVTVMLSTGGDQSAGPAIGTAKSKEEGLAMQQKMAEMQRRGAGGAPGGGGALPAPKSLIPERYTKAESSGLSFKVEKDASKNQFAIDLKE